MKKLRQQDWKNLFSALSILHSDIEPETLGERCIAASNRIISAEITAFDFFTDEGVHTGNHWYDPPGAISQAEFEIFEHVAHEHPFAPDVFVKKRFDAMQTEDFLTSRQFHGTAIYNEFFKGCSVDHQLLAAFSNAQGLIITFNFSRNKNNFSEEERLIANLICQHLQNAFVNAYKIEQLHKIETGLNSALEAKLSGAVILNAERQVVYISEFAQQMAEKYFPHEKTEAGGLPDKLWRWLNVECDKFISDNFSMPAEILIETRVGEQLEVRLIYNFLTRETTVLFEEKRNLFSKMSQCLNLTKRETEILFWISCGKTNKDIAVLLCISPRTVNKHLENVFTKLGVENRTAAVSVAMNKARLEV